MTNNVFTLFPGEPNALDHESKAQDVDIAEREVEVREDTQIKMTASFALHEATSKLSELGFDVSESRKEVFFLNEAMNALVASLFNKEHPVQELADVTIAIEEDDDFDDYFYHQPKLAILKEQGGESAWKEEWNDAPKNRQILMRYQGIITNVYWDGVVRDGFDEPIGWVIAENSLQDIDAQLMIDDGATWAEIPA